MKNEASRLEDSQDGFALGGGLILGYHRINAVEYDIYNLCIAPENFAAHRRALREDVHPISLPRLVQCLMQGVISSFA